MYTQKQQKACSYSFKFIKVKKDKEGASFHKFRFLLWCGKVSNFDFYYPNLSSERKRLSRHRLLLNLNNYELNKCKHWKQINRNQFTNSAMSNIQIKILQPWSIVAKRFMSQVAGFQDLPLIKDSANTESFAEDRTLTFMFYEEF